MKALILTSILLFTSSLLAKDVIYDTTTKLLWQDAKDNVDLSITFFEADKYCHKLIIGEYKDFRLPTLNELQSIVDYNKYKPAIINGFTYAANETYWSTTPFIEDTSEVWTIHFKKGARSVKGRHYSRYVRCVQSN